MKSAVILLGHGSQNSDSQVEFRRLADQVQSLEPDRVVRIAHLQLCEPDLASVISRLAEEKVTEVSIIPVFLFAGNHIQVDIPGLISALRVKFPQITMKMGRHLGPDPEIAKLVRVRLKELAYKDHCLHDPSRIESRSFQIIDSLLSDLETTWTPGEREIVKRVIHTTADPEMARLLDFHPRAVAAGIKAIQAGAPIVTDVKMSYIGIGNKPGNSFGCSLKCCIDDPETAEMARKTGRTRAMAGMVKACAGMKQGIVVIGNAPTALFQLCEMIDSGEATPGLIVGTPVGFVGAAESKEVLKSVGIPYIRTVGPRGGSPVAAAIVNALCRLAAVAR
ncbi:MAG: precorrin-8X methylmutase [Bacillota bacterium]